MSSDRESFTGSYLKGLSQDEIVRHYFYQTQSEKEEVLMCKKCYHKITLKKNAKKHVMTHISYYESPFAAYFEDDPRTGKVRCKKDPKHLVQYNYASRHYDHCQKEHSSLESKENPAGKTLLEDSESKTVLSAEVPNKASCDQVVKKRKLNSNSKFLSECLTSKIVEFANKLPETGIDVYRNKVQNLLVEGLYNLEATLRKSFEEDSKKKIKILLRPKSHKKHDNESGLAKSKKTLRKKKVKEKEFCESIAVPNKPLNRPIMEKNDFCHDLLMELETRVSYLEKQTDTSSRFSSLNNSRGSVGPGMIFPTPD